MKFSSVIERAATILWQHRVLAALGVLDVALTGSGLLGRAAADLGTQALLTSPLLSGLLAPYADLLPAPLIDLGQVGALFRSMEPYGAAGWAALITGALVVLVALAVAGLTIEGGVIAAVSRAELGEPVTVRGVFAAGWRRIVPMVVIASVPAIPLTLGAILLVVVATGVIQASGGLPALAADPALGQSVSAGLLLLSLAVIAPLMLITPPLELLTVIAYRACMLENLAAVAALRRAWAVLRAQLGPALLLVLVGYVVSMIASTLNYLPNLLADIFLPAILIVWLIRGIARAYFLALWTVGWRWMAGEANGAQKPG